MVIRKISLVMVFVLGAALTVADSTRKELTADTLLRASSLDEWVNMDSFTSQAPTAAAVNSFEGRLRLFNGSDGRIRIIRDDYQVADLPELKLRQLPAFDFEFVQDGRDLIPKTRGTIANTHPQWEYILEPGLVWQEQADGGYSRASVPFSLQERNANCTHNGVLSFLFKNDGSISKVAYQIASETCMYLKFNMRGLIKATYKPSEVVTAEKIKADFREEVAGRLPVKAIAQLALDYPGVDSDQFGSKRVIGTEHMTVYGFVIDGVNYIGGCETRLGTYPYCEVLDVPSYSLAKSIVAGLGLMRMEKLYPGTRNLMIADYVDACKPSGNWRDVTFEHTLDMVTGNYILDSNEGDEASAQKGDGFFVVDKHAQKIDFSCNHFPRKFSPGAKWVYHTSDTYLLGAALNKLLKKNAGSSADIYKDIVWPLLEPLKLSPAVKTLRRSYDRIAQPFSGYGLTLHVDDIAKIARFVSQLDSDDTAPLDGELLNGALQRVDGDRGYLAANTGFRYNNGFWGKDMQQLLGCKEAIWLPFMSGYGGISVVLMPNDTVYYNFSDSGKYSWKEAAVESHKLRAFCS